MTGGTKSAGWTIRHQLRSDGSVETCYTFTSPDGAYACDSYAVDRHPNELPGYPKHVASGEASAIWIPEADVSTETV